MRFSTLLAVISGGSAAPVVPSGPQHAIASSDGLGGYTFDYQSETGFFVVQIVGRNNAASDPGVSVTWGGVAVDAQELPVFTSTAGTPFAWTGVYYAADPGTKSMVVSCTGSAGQALILVTPLSAADSFWPGSESSATEASSSTITTPYESVGLNPGEVFQSVCWLVPGASIAQGQAATLLWASTAGNTSAAFYTIENTVAPALFGWTVASPGAAVANVVEVQGALL